MMATDIAVRERDVGPAVDRLATANEEQAGPAPLAREANSAASATEDDIAAAERTAHRSATKPSIQEIAAELNALFGRELLAVMTGVQSPRTVTQWIRGESAPHPGTAKAL